jgi:signal transduction histidine kinase
MPRVSRLQSDRPPHPGSVLSGLRGVVAPTGRLTVWGVLGVGVCALAWTLAAAALAIYAVHGNEPVGVSQWLMDVLSAVVYGAATALMLPRTRHPVVWIILLVALGCGISGLVTQLLLIDPQPPTVDTMRLSLFGYVAWMPGTYGSLAVLPWLVLRGQGLASEAWLRGAAGLGVVATATASVVSLTHEYQHAPPNPYAPSWEPWRRAVDALDQWPDRLCLALSAVAVVQLTRVWWRLRGTARPGFGWLAIGQGFLTAAFVPVFVVRLEDWVFQLSGISLILAQAFLPVALLVVVLRQQLWGVDLVLSRVTVWAMLTGAVLTGYAVLAWSISQLIPRSEGLAAFVAVGVVVALGQPVRHWLQEQVDRLVYGDAVDPGRLLDALGRDLGDGRSGTSLTFLVASLRDGLRLGGIEVRAADGEVRAVAGSVSTAELRLPLVVEGRYVGLLTVAAPHGQRIDQRTHRLVAQMGSVLAVALELAHVNDQLTLASGRLVEVRHEERRLLRRDLHDGMGPALAGVGLGLAAAQRRLTHDPEGAASLLAELETEVERRTDDIRLLARALLPAQLDDGDLPRALGVLAERFGTSGIRVDVECEIQGELSTRLQIAVYHVAAEALMNAYRHAHATSVHIRVQAPSGGPLTLEVVDDGRGLGHDRSAGVGLTSMRERADELGGTLRVEPRADGLGTRVRMELP